MPTDVEGIWNRVVDYRPLHHRAQVTSRMPAALDA
jgi:hypothetical protein